MIRCSVKTLWKENMEAQELRHCHTAHSTHTSAIPELSLGVKPQVARQGRTHSYSAWAQDPVTLATQYDSLHPRRVRSRGQLWSAAWFA